jgi:crotonobetaine/carnitine-CoA ligase
MVLGEGILVTRPKMSVGQFWPDVRRFGCTYGQLLGSMARLLMQPPESAADADNPMQFATMLPMLPDVEEFERRFGIRVGTLFTMTETSTPIVTQGTERHGVASCGRIRPGCEVRLVDELDYEVPDGTIGQLIVRTDEPWTLNAGYWNKPAETAAACRNGWFHTGDAFRRDESGNYYYVDRFKDVIRRRGENISSMEVEGLVASHPGVAEVAAIGVRSELEEEDVMIIVVRVPGSALTAPELMAYLHRTCRDSCCPITSSSREPYRKRPR